MTAVCLLSMLFPFPFGYAEEFDNGAAANVCDREKFAAVVDDAGAALRTLNQDNRPTFQAKLAQLRELKDWDHQAFLRNAEPYVRDDKIDAFDAQINMHLRRISQMGDAGSTAKRPDCGVLAELRGHMTELVNTQNAKWTYMLEKLEKAIEDASS